MHCPNCDDEEAYSASNTSSMVICGCGTSYNTPKSWLEKVASDHPADDPTNPSTEEYHPTITITEGATSNPVIILHASDVS
jgi:hypothetical protein